MAMDELHEKSETSKELCQIIALAKNEHVELKGKFDSMSKNTRNKLFHFQALLECSRDETEKVKEENNMIALELTNTKNALDSTRNANQGLLSQKNDSEQALCSEITQLKMDNDNLNSTISDLEKTIMELDGEVNSAQGEKADLLEAQKQIKEIDVILTSYGQETYSEKMKERKNVFFSNDVPLISTSLDQILFPIMATVF